MSTALRTYYITYCAMRVRAHFKNIDEVIATIKSKDRKKDFHDAGLPFPHDQRQLRDGQLGLELPYITVRTFQLFVPLSTIWSSACLLVSIAKDAINVEDLVLDLVKINQYRTLAANVEFLEGSACTIIEAYGLLKNVQFDDDSCAIKDYSKNDYPTLI